MRIAAIDIGTTSVHMIVVQVRPDRSFEVIDREKEMVRLGAGGLGGRALTPGAMDAALQALSRFRRIAQSHQVDDLRAVATSATREAENGGEFLAAIARETGIRARVISGRDEARLIHLAALYGVDIGEQDAVVVDVGGGSVEITLGSAATVRLSRSFKVGVIRLMEDLVTSDPLSRRDERRLVAHVNEEIGEYCAQLRAAGFGRVIGTSGTILNLGAMAWAADRGRAASELRNLRVTAKSVHALRKSLAGLTLEQRQKLPTLETRRADLIVAGAVLLDTILRALHAPEITLCDYALREGIVVDYIARHRTRIARIERYPDVRRRSVIELCERCRYAPEHAQQVSRLATTLFDETRAVHGLSSREREWLEYAALMHDVGTHISYTRHHKHSYYLIRNGDLRGFEPREIDIMALVARYHRQSPPKKSHDDFRALSPDDRRIVRTLAALLRLAEGLERSHSQIVSRIELHDRGDDYLLNVHASGDAELEVWAAHRHMAPFETLLGKPVYVSADGNGHVEQPDDPAPVPRQAARRRRHRRIRQDDAARAARQVADGGRAARHSH